MLSQRPTIERAKTLYYRRADRDAKIGRYWPQVAEHNWALQREGAGTYVVACGGWGNRGSEQVAKWRLAGDRLIRLRLS
jgi:hypothetical protein